MNVILVDDEPLVMTQFELECGDLSWVHVVGCFTSAQEALNFVRTHEVQLVVLDIDMPGMNGLALARALRALQPHILLVFVTGYDQYALEAFQQQALGYLLKPFERDEMVSLLHRAQTLAVRAGPSITVRAFGRFDVFADTVGVVVFKSAKAKELFALCVDHNGGVVEMEEAIDKLWPNRGYDDRVKNLYRKAVSALRDTLAAVGADNVFVSARGCCYINRDACACDYFDELDGAAGRYHGEYLFEYSWAEETNARLYNKCRKKSDSAQ